MIFASQLKKIPTITNFACVRLATYRLENAKRSNSVNTFGKSKIIVYKSQLHVKPHVVLGTPTLAPQTRSTSSSWLREREKNMFLDAKKRQPGSVEFVKKNVVSEPTKTSRHCLGAVELAAMNQNGKLCYWIAIKY